MLKGRRSNGALAEFGETVHFLIPKTRDMPGKFEDRWSEGVWLGCDVRSGEHLVGMSSGVFRVKTVRRKPKDERWSPDNLEAMRGTPKQPVPNQASARAPAFQRRYDESRGDQRFVPQDESSSRGIRSWKIYKLMC